MLRSLILNVYFCRLKSVRSMFWLDLKCFFNIKEYRLHTSCERWQDLGENEFWVPTQTKGTCELTGKFIFLHFFVSWWPLNVILENLCDVQVLSLGSWGANGLQGYLKRKRTDNILSAFVYLYCRKANAHIWCQYLSFTYKEIYLWVPSFPM